MDLGSFEVLSAGSWEKRSIPGILGVQVQVLLYTLMCITKAIIMIRPVHLLVRPDLA
jgi:hypothetical protein